MDKKDCSFSNGSIRFRYKVIGIIIEEDCLLLATTKKINFYYYVGGGVHLGESSEDAVKREVFEETGQSYEISRLFCIIENFFKDSKIPGGQLPFHEICLCYLMQSKGKKFTPDSSKSGVKGEIMEWVPISDLQKIILKPLPLLEIIPKIPEWVSENDIKHIVFN